MTNKMNVDDFMKAMQTSNVGKVSSKSTAKAANAASSTSAKTFDSVDEDVKFNTSSRTSKAGDTSSLGTQKFGGTVVGFIGKPTETKDESLAFIKDYLGYNTKEMKDTVYDSAGRVTYFAEAGETCPHIKTKNYTLEYLEGGQTKVTTKLGDDDSTKKVTIFDLLKKGSGGCKEPDVPVTPQPDDSGKGCGCGEKKKGTGGCKKPELPTPKDTGCGCGKTETKKDTGCGCKKTEEKPQVPTFNTKFPAKPAKTVRDSGCTSCKQEDTGCGCGGSTIPKNWPTCGKKETPQPTPTPQTPTVQNTNVNSNNKVNYTKISNVLNLNNSGIIDKGGNDIYDGEGNDIYVKTNNGIIDTAGNDIYAKNFTTNNNYITNNYYTEKKPDVPDVPDVPDEPDEPSYEADLMPLRSLLTNLEVANPDGVLADSELEAAMNNPTLADMDGDSSAISSAEMAIFNKIKAFNQDKTLITNVIKGNYSAINKSTLDELVALSNSIKKLKPTT